MIKNFSALDNSQIQECLNNNSLKIGIIGIGRIGLPTALSFANSGFDTIGIDINKKLVDMVNSGNYPLKDEPEFDNEQVISERTMSTEESQEFLENEKIEFEGVDFTLLKNTDSELETVHADFSGSSDFTTDSALENWEAQNRSTASLAQEARMKGYEGEACHTCQQFTMVRNG